MDKGYYCNENIKTLDKIDGLSYIIPLKRSSRKAKDNGMLEPYSSLLKGYKDATVLYKKAKTKDGGFLYGFRNPRCAYEQEIGYIEFGQKKGTYSEEKFLDKKDEFGLIVFESRSDLDPLDVYRAYAGRWEIEVMFDLFKNIIELDTVNVRGDYRLYATEFINYLSVIIATRAKRILSTTTLPGTQKSKKKTISDNYSFKQVLRYLSKNKRICSGDSDKWLPNNLVNYVAALCKALDL